MTEPTQLEPFVAARLHRDLHAAGLASEGSSAEEAALAALTAVGLRAAEREALETLENYADGSIDPIAIVLARRIEHALRTGLAAAGAPDTAAPEVLVVRVPSDSDRSTVHSRVTTVLTRWRSFVAERAAGREGRLLILAAPMLHRKVQGLLPSGRIGGVTLNVDDDGLGEEDTAASIELVAMNVLLPGVEEAASAELAALRRDKAESMPEPPPVPAVDVGAMTTITDAETAPADAEAEVDPMIGELFHLKYRIVRCLGRGSFGAVYEALDERGAGNRVAIKVLFGAAAESAAAEQSFKDEARRVTRLSHPNIVDWKVFDETDVGTPYFVMEMVEGEGFEETLARERKLEPERAARLLLQILDALRAAHHLSATESILHLDLKPANLLRVPPRHGREEQLKVLDFGIGQYIGDGEVQDKSTIVPGDGASTSEFGGGTLTFQRQAKESDTDTGVTRSRGCTPEYASPEQCDHVLDMDDIVQLDGRSDLYSLGVVAFEMLAGQLPFKAKNRLDVLQMHRQDVAPKVGSMGVRIPRKLAALVDRCLSKDRDKRFRDTNEAYQALHDVVHPPVWKAVARVTVPIVLFSVAVGAWSWMTREVVVPEVGLITADGSNLETGALFLGPVSPSALLSIQAADDVLPEDTTDVWTVVRALDGVPAPEWKAEWAEAGGVMLSALQPALIGRRVEERLMLVLGEDRLKSRPFTTVHIAEGAWEVSALEVQGRDLDELEAIGIDPLGLALDLELRGEARDDVAEVSVDVGGGAPLSLTRSASSGGRSRYRLELADAGLTNGPNDLRVQLRDQAGTEWSRSVVLTVVDTPLVIAGTVMSDRSGGRDAEGAFPASNKILDAYLISPRTEPMLRVQLVRPADLRWSVFVDGSSEAAIRGQSSGRKTFELDLDGLDGVNGGEAYLGRVEIAVDEDAYVMHADGSSRGHATEPVAFRFENTLPTFAAQWRASGTTRDLESRGSSEPIFTNAANGEFVVTRSEPVPMRVELSWWPDAASGDVQKGDVQSAETSDLLSPQTQQAVLPVMFTSDGEWIVRARSFRYDSAAKAASDRPDVEETFRVVLDRVAPSAGLTGIESGAVLTSIDDAPDELGVHFEGLSSSAQEAGVDLTWRLERTGPTGAVQRTGTALAHDPSTGDAVLALEGSLRDASTLVDGSYRVAVSGSDRAGNEVREASVEFVVALQGPEITLTEPSGVGKWRGDATSGTWTVRALATDPNGVDSISCRWIAGDTTVPVALETEAGSSAVEHALIGHVVFPHTLSEEEVTLEFVATDVHGAPSLWTSETFDLPTITRPTPARIAVSVEQGSAESMRLVHGNDGFQYFFGGRGDAVENGTFVGAGLEPFNASPRRSRSRSWQVPYAAGEIADFYLDEREVSVGQYLAFMEDVRGYASWAWWPQGHTPDAESEGVLFTELMSRSPELPVTGVTWAEAYAYAKWAGKRLPSWVEWEYAVRGGAEYRPYAGYDEAAATSNGMRDDGITGSGDTTLMRGDKWTPGAEFADLCGNVAEWTSTGCGQGPDARYPHLRALADPARLLAGEDSADAYWIAGAHDGHARFDFSVADRRPAASRHDTVGFRCAVSLNVVQDRLGLTSPDGATFREAP